MNINEILNVINKVENKSKYQSNFGLFYRHSFAIDSVNKFDQEFSLKSTKLKDVLAKNEFATKIQELGYKLSIEGTGYAWVIYKYEDEPIIDYAKVYNYVNFMGKLNEVWLHTEKYKTITVGDKEVDVEILVHFWYDDNGNVMKETGWYGVNNTNEWESADDVIKYDTEVIPVLLVKNNALGTRDIVDSANPLIKQMEKYYDMLPRESQKAKTIFAFNEWLNSTNTNVEFEENVIDKGKDTFSLSDPDNKIGNSISPLNVGVAFLQQLQANIGFIDSKIRELSFMFRDHGSDSRKNEYDLVIYNQKAYEYMLAKLRFREMQLQRFIDLLAQVIGIETGKITLKMSEFEKARRDNLNAIVDMKKAQAEQARGVAKKNISEANVLDKGGNTPEMQKQVDGLNEKAEVEVPSE